ncbi:MAG: FixH family protein [Burkholderiales bacterium]
MMPRKFARLVAALAPLVLSQAQAADCDAAPGAAGARAESERYTVVYRTEPATIAVGRAFAIEVQVCAKGQAAVPTGLRVDAQMPAHRHGMNYRPTVVAEGSGRFRADGLLFHMPGRWELIFDLDAPGTHERITRDLLLE